MRTPIPWPQVWTSALLLGLVGALLMEMALWFLFGETVLRWPLPDLYPRLLLLGFLVPSLITWSLLALVLRRRGRTLALVLGALSPAFAFVPACYLYFGEIVSADGLAFLSIGLVFFFPVLVGVGATTGAIVHRLVN